MKKIFKYSLVLCGMILVVWVGIKFMPSQFQSNSEKELSIVSYDNEEKPEEVVSAEEHAVNKRRLERSLKVKNTLKSASSNSSYANSKITGKWEQFRFLTYNGSPYGFRTKGSVYDQENDVLYAIMDPGHLWKINRNPSDNSDISWEIMNHKGDYAASYIDGLNKSDGSFRMIRSSYNGMQYSDDEGRTWLASSGVTAVEKSYEGAIVKTESGNRIHVLLKTSSNNVQVYTSDDNGESYTVTATNFNTSNYYVKLFKVHNSESVFLAAYNYSDSKVSIYEKTVADSDFTLKNTANTTFVSLDNIFGTYYNGDYHFYVGTKYTHIYYSSNKGASWTLSQIAEESGNTNVRTVHPTKPNMVFRGYLDVNVSTNNGASFSNFGHRLGWDVHHMKFYQRKDGSYFHFVGKDFGCYISDTPESWSQYISLNNGSAAQMSYDADHGQNYYSSFTANQDRGTVGFRNTSNEAVTEDVRTTDGLRVTLANNDASVWTWMYFGTIFHKSNFLAENSGLTSINYPGTKWWAAPMIPSPNKSEDAVYLAFGNKLSKLTFNPEQQSIIQTKHYFDFEKETGSEITGFGYSPINSKRWYVSVKNGIFLHSSDGGQTFEKSTYAGISPKANDQTYNYHKNQHVIRASSNDDETVYYAGVGNVFLISKDGGKTFTNHNNGLDVYRIRDFDLSADEKYIYAACGTGGIWVYSVDDDMWYEMNDAAIPYVEYTDVEFIVKQNAVKFATYGSGILTFKLEGDYQNIIYPDNLVAEVGSEGTISLQWEDNSDNEEGFIIERASNGVFQQVASVSANQTLYTDTDELEAGLYSYRIKAFNSAGESYYSNYSLVKIGEEGIVPKSTWTLVSVDSEDLVNPQLGTYAFDDDESTFWFTQWSGAQPAHPHEIVIDMNANNSFLGFGYLPRQDGKTNGYIKEYEFYNSMDNVSWTKVSSGIFDTSSDWKYVYFSSAKEARYIKLVAYSCSFGTNFTGCAELSLVTEEVAPKYPVAPQFVQGGRLSDTEIELIWMDKSNNENGFIVEQLIDGFFTPIYTSTSDVTSYILGNTVDSESYSFRVASFNNVGDSEYSDTMVIKSIGTAVVVGVEDKIWSEKSLKVYPNPFDNQLNVQLGTPGLFTDWKVLDTSGRLIKNGKISKNSTLETIMVDGLKPGLYVLSVGGENGWKSKKVIKK